MNFLTFDFTASEYNGWPKAQISVNNMLVSDIVADSSDFAVTVCIDYPDGIYDLDIVLHSKTNANTLFVDGQIIKDQILTLRSISFNNIRLADHFLLKGIYYYNDQVEPGVVSWGVNGKWCWQFGIPFIQWAVDSTEHLQHPDLITPHANNAAELKNKITNLRKIWQ